MPPMIGLQFHSIRPLLYESAIDPFGSRCYPLVCQVSLDLLVVVVLMMPLSSVPSFAVAIPCCAAVHASSW